MVMNNKQQIFGVVKNAEKNTDYEGISSDTVNVKVNNTDRTIQAEVNVPAILGTSHNTAYSGFEGNLNRNLIINLTDELSDEIERSANFDDDIQDQLNDLASDVTSSDAEIVAKIMNLTKDLEHLNTKTDTSDSILDSKISDVSQRLTEVYLSLNNSLTEEINRSTEVDINLQEKLTADYTEINECLDNLESKLNIFKEESKEFQTDTIVKISTLELEDVQVREQIEIEKLRATDSEQKLHAEVTAEVERAITTEVHLQEQILNNATKISEIYVPEKLSEFNDDIGFAINTDVTAQFNDQHQTIQAIDDYTRTLETKDDSQLKYNQAIAYTDECVKTLLGEDVEDAYNSFKDLQDLLKEDAGVTVNLLSDVSKLKTDIETKASLDYVSDLENNLESDINSLNTTKSDKDHKHLISDILDYSEPDLTPYAKIIDIPKNVSELTNDLDYLQPSALKGYATETFVKAEIDAIPDVDLSGKSDIRHTHKLTEITDYETPHIPTNVSELNNDKGYLTEHQDISHLATKDEIPDVSKFITVIPEEYVTETELSAKGYITEHQSLDNYATKSFVEVEISKIPEPDLTPYAKISDIPTRISQLTNDASYVSSKVVNDIDDRLSQVELFFDAVDNEDEYINTLSEIQKYIEEDVAGASAITSSIHQLEDRVNNIPTKISAFENDANYLVETDLTSYAKKSDIPDVDSFISEIPDEYITETKLMEFLSNIEFIDGGNAPL